MLNPKIESKSDQKSDPESDRKADGSVIGLEHNGFNFKLGISMFVCATPSRSGRAMAPEFDSNRIRFGIKIGVINLIKIGSEFESNLGSEFRSKDDPFLDPTWKSEF